MTGIKSEIVSVGEFSVETHARLEYSHVLHASHVLTLSDDYWLSRRRHCGIGYHKLALIDGGNLRFKQCGGNLALLGCEFCFLGVFFAYKVVNNIAIHTHKARFLIHLLE